MCSCLPTGFSLQRTIKINTHPPGTHKNELDKSAGQKMQQNLSKRTSCAGHF